MSSGLKWWLCPVSPFNYAYTHFQSCSEVIAFLTRHGCNDLTSALNGDSPNSCPIAGGGLGDIFRGQLVDGTLVAIKTIRAYEGHSRGKYNKRAAKEIYTWSKCNHPNVVKLLGLAVFRDSLAMISPWAANGNLQQYLLKHQSADRCCLRAVCLNGFTHVSFQVHGDLKGVGSPLEASKITYVYCLLKANVLIAEDGTPMLTDFGNSSLQGSTLQFTQTNSQPSFSFRWTAPEIIRGKSGHTTAGDVYSLGMTILEVLTSEIPFPKKADRALYGHIVIGKKMPRRPDIIPERSILGNMLWAILTSCWSYEPKLRPDAATVWDALKLLTPDKLTEIEETVESNADDMEDD
ncbi:unnamed protein product [Rhizoctonia solani]|uniref:Protein kinase domain-containing protein n=1 Tax=Rhizoctonia solani TaxID=456999 RepID=A0A8H3AZ17_9AGAM|nr:unnamed protein product [Rhizoctonia solani]